MSLQTSPKRHIRPPIVSVITIAFLALAARPVRAQGAAKAGPAHSQWRAKYVGGTEPVGKAKNPKVDLRISETALDMTGRKELSFSIALLEITRVDSKNLRPAHAAMAGLKTAGQVEGAFAESSVVDAGATAILYGMFGFVPTMGISAIVHSKDKYLLTVAWGEPPEGHEARLELGAGEYSSFLSELRRTTGKQWFNLREEEQSLQKKTTQHVSFRLTHPGLVASQTLKKGPYQIVPVDRDGAPPSLVFIAGNSVNAHKVRTVVPAEIVQEPDAPATPVVSEQEGAMTRITEVNVAGKCFRVKSESASPSKPLEAHAQASTKTI